MHFSKAVVKYRVPILILTLLLMIPSVFGMAATRVNYDMLTYLPEDMETVIGQNELLEDFNKGAFTFLIFEDMPARDAARLKEKVESVGHVDTVLWYDSLADLSMPMELLPDRIYREFNTDHSTMMAVFFDSGTSEDVTMDAVKEIRQLCGGQCFVSGMSALVVDLKDLCEQEEPVYVALAVALACAAMLLLDGWLIPFVFLASIGAMILLNLGTNYFFGEISYITKALSAVLQLAVTMDYSIFLWHSYNEQRALCSDSGEAMARAIQETLTSVIGSSVTTISGFIALCFMGFTLGRDLGLVMAKGVLLGVLGCVTVLPALILVLDKPLQKTKHRSIIPDMRGLSRTVVRIFPVFLAVFALLIPPFLYGYDRANDEVYYDMGQCLPEDMNYVISNSKLREDFNIASTHMALVRADLSPSAVKSMMTEMEQTDGVKYVLGLESVVGSRVPQELLPESVRNILESDRWELLLINSEYAPASDSVNLQITRLNEILKRYDADGHAHRRGPLPEGHDRDHRSRLRRGHGGVRGRHLPHHPAGGEKPVPAADSDRGHRGGHLHQSGPEHGLHHPHLHQHHPTGRHGGLRHSDDHPVQIRAHRRQGEKGGRLDGPLHLHPLHSGVRTGHVRGHLRRGPVFRHRDRQLHVHAHGPRRGDQHAAGDLRPARHVHAAGPAHPRHHAGHAAHPLGQRNTGGIPS